MTPVGLRSGERYASAEEVLAFLHADRCRLVCRRLTGVRPTSWEERREARRAGSGLIFIEYSHEASQPHVRAFEHIRAFAPLLSPDGNRVVYSATFAPSDLAILSLDTGESRQVGVGAHPHWWVDPATQAPHVIYRTENGIYTGFPMGKTLRQRLGQGAEPVGRPELICPYGFSGGISRSGRWMATGYTHLIMVNLETGEYFQPLGDRQLPDGENQVCDVSMSPDDSPRAMHLRLTLRGKGRHDFFGIARFDGTDYQRIDKGEDIEEWQTPEWSSDPDFATVSGTNADAGYDVYAVRLTDQAVLRLTWGTGFGHAHLWLRHP